MRPAKARRASWRQCSFPPLAQSTLSVQDHGRALHENVFAAHGTFTHYISLSFIGLHLPEKSQRRAILDRSDGPRFETRRSHLLRYPPLEAGWKVRYPRISQHLRGKTMSHNLFDDTFVITGLNPHKKRFARGKKFVNGGVLSR